MSLALATNGYLVDEAPTAGQPSLPSAPSGGATIDPVPPPPSGTAIVAEEG